RATNEVQVADCVQDLVLDEFVVKAQAVGIKDAVFVHHNCVIETAAASQACGTQGFDLAGKAEGTRSGDRLDVGIFLEIHLSEIRSGVDGRMLEVDGE